MRGVLYDNRMGFDYLRGHDDWGMGCVDFVIKGQWVYGLAVGGCIYIMTTGIGDMWRVCNWGVLYWDREYV